MRNVSSRSWTSGALGQALLIALALGALQLQSIGTAGGLASDPIASAVLWTLFSARSLGLLLPGVALRAGIPRLAQWTIQPTGRRLPHRAARFWDRLAVSGWMVWALGCAVYVQVDATTSRIFGRRFVDYLAYVDDPDVGQWVGSLDVLRGPGAQLVLPLVLLVAAVVLGGLLRRLVHERTRALAARIALAVLLLPAIGISAGSRLNQTPAFMAEAPRSWLISALRIEKSRHVADREAEQIVAAYRPSLERVPPPLRGEGPARRHPHVVLLVLDSFRFTALNPTTMPELEAFSSRGTRFETHFAGSDASHGGFFSILYGRPPLDYYELLERGRLPDLPRLLGREGYRTHFLTGAHTEWQSMEGYLDEPAFDAQVVDVEGPIFERDVRTIGRIREILATAESPVFVVGFLLSTHYPYVAPPAQRPFGPTPPLPPPTDPSLSDRVEQIARRYRTAARFLDGELARLWKDVDLSETLVLVTGDHGESLFDDGTLAHASRPSRAQTHVPLVIAGAGTPSGRVDRTLSSHVDLLPTILGRLGVRLEGHPARDLLGTREPPKYVPILRVDPDSPSDLVYLRSTNDLLGFQISRGTVSSRAIGRHDDNGQPLGSGVAPEDVARSLRALEDFLIRWTDPP